MAGAAVQSGVVFRQLTAIVNWVETKGNDSLDLQKLKKAANCLLQKVKLGDCYQKNIRTQCQHLGLPRFNKVLQDGQTKYTNKSNSDLETRLTI